MLEGSPLDRIGLQCRKEIVEQVVRRYNCRALDPLALGTTGGSPSPLRVYDAPQAGRNPFARLEKRLRLDLMVPPFVVESRCQLLELIISSNLPPFYPSRTHIAENTSPSISPSSMMRLNRSLTR